MAGPGVQTLAKEGWTRRKRERKNNYMGRTRFKCSLEQRKECLCAFKQTPSWVEGCWWWRLRWAVLALTELDIMARWKMSCQLIEELPVAAGRSVVTEAMCVNLLPCHFFCLASRLPFISTYFSFPFLLHLLPLGLHSLYLVLCDKLLLAVDLLLVKSASFAGMKVGWAGGGNTSQPPYSTCLHLQSLAHSTPHTHTRHEPNVEMSHWKLIFLSHKISSD